MSGYVLYSYNASGLLNVPPVAAFSSWNKSEIVSSEVPFLRLVSVPDMACYFFFGHCVAFPAINEIFHSQVLIDAPSAQPASQREYAQANENMLMALCPSCQYSGWLFFQVEFIMFIMLLPDKSLPVEILVCLVGAAFTVGT